MLFKRRPRLEVRAPEWLESGVPFEVELLVDVADPVAVEALEVLLVGQERVSQGARATTVIGQREIFRSTVPLAGAGVLAAGRSSYRATLTVPAGATPSRGTAHVTVRWAVLGRARIAWWPDALDVAELQVAPPPSPPLEGAPQRAMRLAPDGPFELSVASDAAPLGGLVRVAVSLADPARWTELRAELQWGEALATALNAFVSAGELLGNGVAARQSAPIDGAAPHAALELAVPIPADAVPSVVSQLWRLDWSLQVTAVPAAGDAEHAEDGAQSLRIPLRLWRPAAGAAGAAPPPPPPPQVGDARVEEAWRAAAAELGLPLDPGMQLSGRAGEVEAVVRREDRGAKGAYFVGEVRWPPLGIGLHVGPAPVWVALLGRVFPLGDEEFDVHHIVGGRHGRQVTSFMLPLVKLLKPLRAVRVDDDGVRVEERASTVPALVTFTRAVLALAPAADDALRALPPPPAMEAVLPAWRVLAERLGGPLHTGNMRVAGRWSGHAVEVATTWDWRFATPSRTVITFRPEPPLADTRTAVFEWHDAPGAAAVAPPATELQPAEAWPPSTGPLLAELRAAAHALRIAASPEALTLELPAPLADAAPAVACLDLLAVLAAALAQGRGPYR
jgi:hypothetical protein